MAREVDQEALGALLDQCAAILPEDESSVWSRLLGAEGEGGSELWLGTRRVAEDASRMRLLGVTHCVNAASGQVTNVFAAEAASPVKYWSIDLEDRGQVITQGQGSEDAVEVAFDARAKQAFYAASEFIDEAMAQAGSIVFVHCAGGVSRSASIVLAFLLLKRQMCLRDAWLHVKSRREVIAPNAGFFHVLLDLEQEISGVETMHRPTSMHARDFRVKEPAGEGNTSPVG